MCICNPRAAGTKINSLVSHSSWSREPQTSNRPCLKIIRSTTIRWCVTEDTRCWPLASTCVEEQAHQHSCWYKVCFSELQHSLQIKTFPPAAPGGKPKIRENRSREDSWRLLPNSVKGRRQLLGVKTDTRSGGKNELAVQSVQQPASCLESSRVAVWGNPHPCWSRLLSYCHSSSSVPPPG